MSSHVEAAINQLDDVLAAQAATRDYGIDTSSEAVAARGAMRIRLIAVIERLAPKNSSYLGKLTSANMTEHIVGAAMALRDDYKAGYLRSIGELIHADTFADMLEAAEYQLQEGYKLPAAVMCGAVLEEHLRQMCVKAGIDILKSNDQKPKKADSLNTELASGGHISKLESKSVTAWQGVRNVAAHGHNDKYSDAQVQLMIAGVRNFISSHPA